MKQIIILIISVIISLSAGLYEINYLKNTTKYFNADINHIKNKINSQDFEEADIYLNKVEKSWNKIKNIWDIFVNHEDINQIEEEMLSCKLDIKSQDKEDSLKSVERLKRDLNNIYERKKIKLQNII